MSQELQPPHIISSEQFNHEQLLSIFAEANKYRQEISTTGGRRELASTHLGRQVSILFYEPSTRTRVSFAKAALNFGMGYDSTSEAAKFSSAAKGETIEDTIQVLDEYGFDAIILRHGEDDGVERAASVARTPIINAGSGKREHPTQSVLDAQTIFESKGRLEGLNIVVGGDLAQGRTAKSLIKLLSKYEGNTFTLVSPPELGIGDDVTARLEEHNRPYHETVEVHDAVRDADVVYWTRTQLERADDPETAKQLMGRFVIDSSVLQAMSEDAIIMHPLPRIGEILPEVDHDPRARYFRQAGNGVYSRMALLRGILDNWEYPSQL